MATTAEVPVLEPAQQQMILGMLRQIGNERQRVIAEAKARRAAAAAAYEAATQEARRAHHEANETLVQAVARAQYDGIPKRDICAALEMTPQNLNQMKRAVEARKGDD